jgi:hypothetical protein
MMQPCIPLCADISIPLGYTASGRWHRVRPMAGMCKIWRAKTTRIRDYSRVDEINGVKKFEV